MMSGSNSSHSTSFSITTGGKLLTNDKAFASGKDCFCSGEFYLCNATIPELSPIKNQSSNSTNPSQGTKPFWEVGGKGEQAGGICKNGASEQTQQEIEKLGDLMLKFGEQMRETFG
ncbi:unnamed protein product [Cercospora beticola]|nr:unnamed protein product [Cercospora beticola]